MLLATTGCGKKVDKNLSTDTKQEESREGEEEKELPIISDDGEEIDIESEKEEAKTDSKKTEDGKSSMNTTESEENKEDSGNATQQPERDTEQEKEQESEIGSKDNPIELPFVPYKKN